MKGRNDTARLSEQELAEFYTIITFIITYKCLVFE
jgi:hypothetical protein